MRRTRTIWALLLPSLLGCRAPSSLAWEVELDPSVTSDLQRVSVWITASGCEGSELVFSSERDGEGSVEGPGDALGSGSYGFHGAVLDSLCRITGRACEPAELPRDAPIVTLVRPVDPGPSCDHCVTGTCVGPLDGGPPFDAGPLQDGAVPRDAGPPDAKAPVVIAYAATTGQLRGSCESCPTVTVGSGSPVRFCVNPFNGTIAYRPGGCAASEEEHVVPADGDLEACVSFFTGAYSRRSASGCGSTSYAVTIPAC